jgi:16S rRNA (guanine966-N2)-methyltransferase
LRYRVAETSAEYAMRITAGRFKGRNLIAPNDLAVRPTSDKVRQAIFNIVEHNDFGRGTRLEDARVIDLFAGTGALGIEALSRGARFALLIDDDAVSRSLIRRNVEAFGLTGATKIWRRDATNLGPSSGEPFDLAFLDPPYRRALITPALRALHAGNWLQPAAIVVAETASDEEFASPEGFELLEERIYGDTKVSLLGLQRAT